MSEDDRLNSKLEYVKDSLVEDFTDVIIIGRHKNETYYVTTEDNFANYAMMYIVGDMIKKDLRG